MIVKQTFFGEEKKTQTNYFFKFLYIVYVYVVILSENQTNKLLLK